MRRTLAPLVLSVVALAGLPALTGSAHATQAPVSFGSTASSSYQTNNIAWSVAQSQGKVFVGGSFTSVRPPGAAAGTGEVARAHLVVLDAQTGAPTGCAPSVTGTATATNGVAVRSLAVSPDGTTLYIGGFFSAVDGVARFNLAALDIATCTLSPTFAPSPNSIVRAIAVTPAAVYYGGTFVMVGSVARSHAAAAAPVGATNAGALLPWAPAMDQDVRTLATKPDGTAVVAGGDFNQVNAVADHGLVVLDPTSGANAFVFPASTMPTASVVKDIAVDAAGFYTANEGHGAGVFDGRMAFSWGTYARRWRDTCLGATQAVVVYRGLLYSGSHAHDCGSMNEFPDGSRNHLLAESVDSPTLLPWFPQTNDGIGEMLGPRDMVVAPVPTGGDSMWVVGEFTTVNGLAQQGVTRFGQGPDASAPSTATSSVTSPRPGEVRVAWRRSLDTDDSLLSYKVYKDGAAIPVFSGQASSWFWERKQLTYTETGLVVGSTHNYRVEVSDGTSVNKGVAKAVVVSGVASAYAEQVRADGASFLWRYDEPGDVFFSDSSENGANGTIRGGATYSAPGALAGDRSRAINLTGATTTIYSETRYPWTGSTPFTEETWINTTTTVGGKIMGVGDKQTYQSAAYDKHLYMTNTGQLVFGVRSSGSKTIMSPAAYNDGAWHHVAASLGAAGMTLYVDGVPVASNAAVTTSATFARGYWRVGGDTLSGSVWPSAPTSAFWKGSLDETAVYPTALSPAAIQHHYLLGHGG